MAAAPTCWPSPGNPYPADAPFRTLKSLEMCGTPHRCCAIQHTTGLAVPTLVLLRTCADETMVISFDYAL